MKNIHAITQRRANLGKEMDDLTAKNQAILDKALAEKRDLTADEESQFKSNTDGYAKIKAAYAIYDEQFVALSEQLARDAKTAALLIHGEESERKQPGARPTWAQQFAAQLMSVRNHALNHTPVPMEFGDWDPKSGKFLAAGGSDGAMNEAVPSEGGFLVGADVSEKIFMRSYMTGSILRRCQKQPISATSDRLKLRVVDEDSRADGQRFGGVLAFWQNEADTFLNSRPKFREIELNLNKLTALVFITDELMADAPALEAWVMNNLPDEITFRVEDALVNGTGAGQPLGILNSGALISQAGDGNEVAHNPDVADVLAMFSRFWFPGLKEGDSIAAIQKEGISPSAAQSACWLIDQTLLPGLWQLNIGNAGLATILLYHPPGYSGAGPGGSLLGLPVIPTEHNLSLGNKGDIVLSDWSQYLLADKGGVQSAYSMHVRFLQGEGTFRFTLRIDGQTPWKKPLTPKSGGSTLSPFITLAAR